MDKESSYGQRLKEIRQKYGSIPRDTTTCLKSYDRQQQSRNDTLLDGKYASGKLGVESTTTNKKYSENFDPFKVDLTRKSSALIQKQMEAQQNFDSFLYTQSKEQRLKQIQKIRQSVAQSKKQTMEDWNRQAERSKSRQFQRQKYDVLRERTNTYMQRRTDEGKFSQFREGAVDFNTRNRGVPYSSSNIEPDLGVNFELRRNYDDPSENTHKQNKNIETTTKRMGCVRNSSVNRFDREIEAVPGGISFACTNSIELNNARPVDGNTSPIRGLMKLDSLQKPKRAEPSYNPQSSLPKFAATTYDISNIDKIQQRIQRILAKK